MTTPAAFRRFSGTPSYLTNDALEAAVNCALSLERPLLIKGEPGTGKTLLAQAVAESLGTELGFYKAPYSKFGQLTFEMWRACRLVIDTGIHSEGWSRQQAIDYLVTNAGKDEKNATVEIDRYIASPGQALAYKIGQLKFQALRALATKELGDKFDIRSFHDELLANGSLPLPILEAQVNAWIATQEKPAQ